MFDDFHYTGAPDECSIHWPRKDPCVECRINNGVGQHIKARRDRLSLLGRLMAEQGLIR